MTRFRPYPLLPASTGWIVVSLITLSTLSPGYAQTVDQYSDSLPLIGDQRSEVNWTANYRLGPGDVVKVDIFGAPEYSGEAPVLQDGTVNLLRVGRVAVQGLTFEQAATAIATSFGTYIRRPVITVSPVSLRPIRIAVSGEVNRPGAYSIETSSENQDFDFPSLTEAISQAGGITAQANLKEVEIRRSISPNQKQVTTINLWDLIKTGDLNQDVVLQGGDEVYIPTATALSPEESTELASASFAPTSIKVYVAGEVEQPGLIEVPLNTPLNQAVLIAGGFNRRADQRAVKLVRLNPNGSVTEREVPVDFSQGIGEESNPILMPQDIVVVRRSGAASVDFWYYKSFVLGRRQNPVVTVIKSM